MGFGGLRVLALESRRAAEMEQLILKQGGEPFVAPSMREIPLADNSEAFAFAERLFAGGFDMVILLTGVGTRQLNRLLATRYPETAFAEALRARHGGGARSETRGGAARHGPEAGHRRAGTEYLARIAGGHRGTSRAPDRRSGIRPLQPPN